jgi:molecular chaperone DnaK
VNQVKRDIQSALEYAHAALVAYLDEYLPQLSENDWWRTSVILKLSVSQERLIKEKNITKLSQLDLSALLRVLDKNWYEISHENNLPRHGKSLVNEVRNIRNRLAHHSLETYKVQDAYRDADSIYRFVDMLGVDPDVLSSCKAILDDALSALTNASEISKPAEETLEQSEDDLSDSSQKSEQDHEPEGAPDSKLEPVPVSFIDGNWNVAPDTNLTKKATYVGIDFGTATTVVSYITTDTSGEGAFNSVPMPIRQTAVSGAEVEDHLVPSCIAWYDSKLLVGRAARDLSPKLRQGRNVWSSFKMGLGVDLGVQYPYSELAGEDGLQSILKPQEAAKLFFTYLREEIEEFIQKHNKPPRVYYSVSVPAGFEANQRQDLIDSLEQAGISIEEASLIDEPNAAFLSYLMNMQSGQNNSNFLQSILQKPKNILVFDFGAGTCDISILEVGILNEKISSRNRSISRFMALGGDNIDMEIARFILLPQLCGDQNVHDCFTVNEIEHTVLPHLKPEAEYLKISCSKYARDKGLRTVEDILNEDDIRLQGNQIPSISLRDKEWSIPEPSLSLHEFAKTMSVFVQDNDARGGSEPSILQPVKNAMDKAGLKNDELNMVLFIGGSSENPVITSCIENYFGRFVDCVTPRDLRAHVSQGAAINSIFFHGLGWELIQPITSEPLLVMTDGGGSETVLSEGTVVPSPEIAVSHFFVNKDSQRRVELPICVGNTDRILAVLSLSPPDGESSFNKGDEVNVSCSITRDKILKVRAKVRGVKAFSEIVNPMSNMEITNASKKLLSARNELNQSILHGKGRPAVTALINYGHAACADGRWREAAEVFEAAERLDQDRNFATLIAYNYSRARSTEKFGQWSAIAYERRQNKFTAYNYALAKKRAGDNEAFVRLLKESLSKDRDYPPALSALGHHYLNEGTVQGTDLLNRLYENFETSGSGHNISEADYVMVERAAEAIGRPLPERIKVSRPEGLASSSPFDAENLVASQNDQAQLERNA